MTDTLTGVFNRRRFYELGQYEWAKLERGSHVLSLLMIDLDRFKVVNDRFGHKVGDEVLREVARVVRSQVLRNAHLTTADFYEPPFNRVGRAGTIFTPTELSEIVTFANQFVES